MKKHRVDKYEVVLYLFIFLIMIFNIILFVYREEIINFVDQRFGSTINLDEIGLMVAEDAVDRPKFLQTDLLNDPLVKSLDRTAYQQKNLIGENPNPFSED